jgi:phospholipid/cholesterol/gamma-HCH transport system substrate-binding protein
MIPARTKVNLVVFGLLAALLLYMGAIHLVFQPGGGRTLTLDFDDAAGLRPRNDVTMRGVPVGAVKDVELTQRGLVRVTVELEPGITVPGGTTALITRRSPIGDLTLELVSGTADPLPDGANIGAADTSPPPEAERTIEVLADLLHSVPSRDLQTVLAELSTALRGRGRDLARLSESTSALPERILEVQRELESLITTGPEVTGVFAENADVLADDLTQTALLADILRDRRHDLVSLSRNGARFLEVFGELIRTEKPNISCLVHDFGDINSVLARPDNLQNLIAVLELNHFFFNGADQAVVQGKDGLAWFRVQLLPHTEPSAQQYAGQRPPPDVYAGHACHSRYGPGVEPGSQRGGVYVVGDSRVRDGS